MGLEAGIDEAGTETWDETQANNGPCWLSMCGPGENDVGNQMQ